MGKSIRGGRGRADVVPMVTLLPKTSKAWQIASLLIRARAELLILVVMVSVYVWLRELLTPPAPTDVVDQAVADAAAQTATTQAKVILGVTVVVVLVLPWSRRFVLARLWCVADRHRLRACLVKTKIRTMNLDGSLPLMLWARPTKTGERVWLWIRAGSSAGDIENTLEYIAPACLARAARLHRVQRLTTIVAVELIRRDPLAKSVIRSPLAKLTTRIRGHLVGEGTEPIAPAPVIPLHPPTTSGPTSSAGSAGSSVGKSARRTTLTPVPSKGGRPVVVVNGEDLSDYVD